MMLGSKQIWEAMSFFYSKNLLCLLEGGVGIPGGVWPETRTLEAVGGHPQDRDPDLRF